MRDFLLYQYIFMRDFLAYCYIFMRDFLLYHYTFMRDFSSHSNTFMRDFLHFVNQIHSSQAVLCQCLHFPVVDTSTVFREVNAHLVFLSAVIGKGSEIVLAVDLLHRCLSILFIFKFQYIDAALGFQHHVDSAIRCRHLWSNITSED